MLGENHLKYDFSLSGGHSDIVRCLDWNLEVNPFSIPPFIGKNIIGLDPLSQLERIDLDRW